jgi:hypothetical protein
MSSTEVFGGFSQSFRAENGKKYHETDHVTNSLSVFFHNPFIYVVMIG